MTSERLRNHNAQREKLKILRAARDEIAPYRIQTIPAVTASTDVTQLDDVLGRFSSRQHDEIQEFEAPIVVNTGDANALLAQLRSRWDEQTLTQLIGGCRTSVINSIVGPFGLGSVVAAMDKNGGNVTTDHNAMKGVYARDEEVYVRSEYAGSAYCTARDNYKDSVIIENSQKIQDEYSGDDLDSSQVQCDHIKPVNLYHREGGWRQTKEIRKKFGSDSENFAMTSAAGNQSLLANDKFEWQQKVATDKSGKINKDLHGHDNRRVKAAVERGNNTAKKYADSVADKFLYDGKNAATTGGMEGGKLGLQQSMGLLLTEFFSASFDEISDAYKNGFTDSLKGHTFFDSLKIRLTRISKKVAKRWKDAVIAFKDGAISGFLSNLVTMLINMLVTTGKRIIRVIREGFMSILKALKMALFPPEGMTSAEAGDAALKLLATGVTVSLGILAEDVVEKSVATFFATNIPPLAPLGSTVSTVLVGAITGIATALLVAALDKLDLFGVRKKRGNTALMRELDLLIVASDRNIQFMYKDEVVRMDVILMKLQTP